MTIRAYQLQETNGGVRGRLVSLPATALDEGDVTIRVEYSSINYKDALAATGKGAIARRLPLIGGIDLAGEVVESKDAKFKPGAKVLVCGSGLSETHDGGYAELARVPAGWIVPLTAALDTRSAMAIGTAGLTAALAVNRLESVGQVPALGPIAVTGATGGVGSFAIDLLAARGFEVVAVTGKTDSSAYLKSLGAADIVDRRTLGHDRKPLGRARWGGAIDNLGGEVLADIIKTTVPGGAIACIGLAASPKLETTVLPFILRGISLLGINSVNLTADLRDSIWQRLGTDLLPRHLDKIVTSEVGLDDLESHFTAYIEGQVRGRSVVRIA